MKIMLYYSELLKQDSSGKQTAADPSFEWFMLFKTQTTRDIYGLQQFTIKY